MRKSGRLEVHMEETEVPYLNRRIAILTREPARPSTLAFQLCPLSRLSMLPHAYLPLLSSSDHVFNGLELQ